MSWANKNHLRIIISLVLSAIFLGGIFFYSFYVDYKNWQKSDLEDQKRGLYLSEIEEKFKKIDTEALSISVWSIDSGEEVYGLNSFVPLPLASLTKIMTALISLSQPSYSVEISQRALSMPEDSGLLFGELWDSASLNKFMLVTSSNDAAYALGEKYSEEDFIEKMNREALNLNLKTLSFFNTTGLDISETEAGAYGSAQDINKLIVYFWQKHQEVALATTNKNLTITSETGPSHDVTNTNTLIEKYPNVLFSKTGLTKMAGGNLSMIVETQNSRRWAITILSSSKDGRFKDMEKIINVLYNLNNVE